MRLREVRLQGYKSFASKHRFSFPGGITAIVGPNGSGKSNIADGIRWVLGEQRAAQLRARKSEELIFHGTERRARAGLAEVTLLLDNSDRWLDIDFAEVAVSRRAHRDGSSEYLLNGARVRLRDVLDLLGSRLGQSNYTVIGQGLVDSALALRPEDRRSLIDEAAGILPLQRRRDRALRQLAETQENLTRVRDVSAELGPRLKRMERLAERARQHRQVAEALTEALRTWYGYQWHRAQVQLERSRGVLRGAADAADRARQEAQALEAGMRQIADEAEAADERLATWRAEREALALAVAAAHQDLAVAQARIEALQLSLADLDRERVATESDLLTLQGRSAQLAAEIRNLGAVHRLAREHQDQVQAELARAEAGQAAHSAGAESAQIRLAAVATELTGLRQQAAALEAKIEVRLAERARVLAEHDNLAAAAAPLAAAVATCTEDHQAAERELARAVDALDVAEAELVHLSEALRAARDAHAAARANREGLSTRAGALEALVGDLEDLGDLRSRLQSAGVEVLGTVAEYLSVEPGWEAAVAALLAHRIHGIVLEGSLAVERALERLLQQPAGQVTLVPVGPEPVPGPPLAAPARAPGTIVTTHGPAGLVSALFANTAFVADLIEGRQVLASPGAPAAVATRDGVLLLGGGVVVVGIPGTEVLALQAERRSLPEAIRRALAAENEAAAEVDRLAAARRGAEDHVGLLVAARSAAEQARGLAADRLASARADWDDANRKRDWAAITARQLATEAATMEAEVTRLVTAMAERLPLEETLQSELADARSYMTQADLESPRAALAEARAELARLAERLAGLQAALVSVGRDEEATRHRRESLDRRAEESRGDEKAWLARIAAARDEVTRHEQALKGIDALITPAEEQVRQARGALRQETDVAETSRRRLAELEARGAEARVDVARAEDRIERLYDQLRADGEWLPDLEALPEQLPLEGLGDLGLPRVTDLPPDIEHHLSTLRRELRAIGAIDQEALSTYEETLAHFENLTTQAADLEQAERDVRRILEDLELQMSARFETTFQAVAVAFARQFSQLFGGGEAALVATTGGIGEAAGIEIVARPPGKRRQPLSLLSGGERALTAVALIFALLEVSATPFVVLDEVDAALDEANVDRFCAALSALAERTQVVIVTHNRNTIQVAGTVYGVSMGDDGASQVISLRVDGSP